MMEWSTLSTAEVGTGLCCFWKCRVPGPKGVGWGGSLHSGVVGKDAGRHLSSLSILSRYLLRSCSVFLSDEPHFILTITREDVQQWLLKLDAWKSGLNNCCGRAGMGILHPGDRERLWNNAPLRWEKGSAEACFQSEAKVLQVFLPTFISRQSCKMADPGIHS